MTWTRENIVSNKATLDKLTDNGTNLLFNGTPITGGSTSPSVSKWAGKVWNVVGDSITENNALSTKHYYEYIKDELACTVNNYGVSGTGWFTHNGPSLAFYNRITALNANADLITVFGGTNDWQQVGKTLVMGSLGDTDGSTSFYGAVTSTLTQLITKYPTKTIAVFTPLPRNNNWATNATGTTLEQVTDAIIKVANKYSIPVLDLYRESNLYAWDENFRTYAMPDGLHPNAEGHKILADKILSFINSL